MLKIYDWNAAPCPDKPGEIEVNFHIQGVTKPDLWIILFEKGKSIIEGDVRNVFEWITGFGLFVYGLFKRTR